MELSLRNITFTRARYESYLNSDSLEFRRRWLKELELLLVESVDTGFAEALPFFLQILWQTVIKSERKLKR